MKKAFERIRIDEGKKREVLEEILRINKENSAANGVSSTVYSENYEKDKINYENVTADKNENEGYSGREGSIAYMEGKRQEKMCGHEISPKKKGKFGSIGAVAAVAAMAVAVSGIVLFSVVNRNSAAGGKTGAAAQGDSVYMPTVNSNVNNITKDFYINSVTYDSESGRVIIEAYDEDDALKQRGETSYATDENIAKMENNIEGKDGETSYVINADKRNIYSSGGKNLDVDTLMKLCESRHTKILVHYGSVMETYPAKIDAYMVTVEDDYDGYMEDYANYSNAHLGLNVTYNRKNFDLSYYYDETKNDDDGMVKIAPRNDSRSYMTFFVSDLGYEDTINGLALQNSSMINNIEAEEIGNGQIGAASYSAYCITGEEETERGREIFKYYVINISIAATGAADNYRVYVIEMRDMADDTGKLAHADDWETILESVEFQGYSVEDVTAETYDIETCGIETY